MYPIFKVGDIVYTEITGDIIRVTHDSGEKRPVFTGEVIEKMSRSLSFKSKGHPKGYFSYGWWKHAFKKYTGKLNNLKII